VSVGVYEFKGVSASECGVRGCRSQCGGGEFKGVSVLVWKYRSTHTTHTQIHLYGRRPNPFSLTIYTFLDL
jgi:hypothetical protein